jgi:hypothetical protein
MWRKRKKSKAKPEAPAPISERMETEHARLRAEAEPDWNPAEDYQRELGIGQPQTDAEKREADAIAALPHESRASNETKDRLQELQEANTAAVAGFQWGRQEELGEAHEDERIGRILPASTFVEMLWKAGIVCVLTRCDTRGLRSLKGEAHARERRALYEKTMAGLVITSTRAMPLPAPRYVTWVQIPAMIEYSVMRFDEHNLPTTQKYKGWRTVLLELIRQGWLTEREANRVFGEPRGPAAKRWGEILQSMRSQGLLAS